MFIPEKNEFMMEVMEIEQEEIRQKLEKIYKHLLGAEKIEKVNNFTKEVIEDLFYNKFYSEVMIPLSFHETVIGKAIFTVMYSDQERMFTVNEIIELTKTTEKPDGYTRQYIGQEIKDERLKACKKNNRWVVAEEDLNEYFASKGLPLIK